MRDPSGQEPEVDTHAGLELRGTMSESYARRGAEARLRELADEAKQLLKVFPDLSASFDEDELPLNFILRRGARKVARRQRRKMTAAQRKAVGERMRKYWAQRRKAK